MGTAHQAWNVYLRGRLIDTVFFTPDLAALVAGTIDRWDSPELSTDVMDDFVRQARALIGEIAGDK